MTRLAEPRRGMARHGRHGAAGRDTAWSGEPRHGLTRRGTQGAAWHGRTRQGRTWLGEARQGEAGTAWPDWSRLGKARRGKAGENGSRVQVKLHPRFASKEKGPLRGWGSDPSDGPRDGGDLGARRV
jgi:hypothetical protein